MAMERHRVTASSNGTQDNQITLSLTSSPPEFNLQNHSFASCDSLPSEIPKSVPQQRLSCRMVHDTELNIFQAERYFKETLDHKKDEIIKRCSSVTVPDPNFDKSCRCDDDDDISSSVPRFSSVSSVDRSKSSRATPTASSEASWNSQSGLLSNILPGSVAVSMTNLPLHRKRKWYSRKWLLGGKCPCTSNKSIQVVEKKLTLHNAKSSKNIPTLPTRLIDSQAKDQQVVVVVKAPKAKGSDHENNYSRGAENCHETSMVTDHEGWAKGQDVVNWRSDSGKLSPGESFREHGRTDEKKNKKLVITGNRDEVRRDRSARFWSGNNYFATVPSRDEEAFSFPVLNSPSNGSSRSEREGQMKSSSGKAVQLDPPRESLEVLQAAEEYSLMVLHGYSTETAHWTHVLSTPPDYKGCQSFTFAVNPAARLTTDDDLASDASSDLFEIESFSSHPPQLSTRNSLDDVSSYDTKRLSRSRRSLDETNATSSIVPTESYDPSY